MASGRKTGHTLERLMELQHQARKKHIEVEGKLQCEVAKIMDINEGTISEWVTKNNWLSVRKTELIKLQQQCKRLIEVDGLKVKEVSEITKVGLSTISKWIATLNWQRVDILAIKRHDAQRVNRKWI